MFSRWLAKRFRYRLLPDINNRFYNYSGIKRPEALRAVLAKDKKTGNNKRVHKQPLTGLFVITNIIISVNRFTSFVAHRLIKKNK
jgi:hypothetical protein